MYRLGDKKITWGFGHAETIKTSKYRVGYKISKEQAIKLLFEDVNVAAAGVKRMFEQWKQEGIDIKVTQGQYNVLVSLAFNMGVSNFRSTEFVQKLKQKDFARAAELIKNTGISHKFPGLVVRRLREYNMFIS